MQQNEIKIIGFVLITEPCKRKHWGKITEPLIKYISFKIYRNTSHTHKHIHYIYNYHNEHRHFLKLLESFHCYLYKNLVLI